MFIDLLFPVSLCSRKRARRMYFIFRIIFPRRFFNFFPRYLTRMLRIIYIHTLEARRRTLRPETILRAKFLLFSRGIKRETHSNRIVLHRRPNPIPRSGSTNEENDRLVKAKKPARVGRNAEGGGIKRARIRNIRIIITRARFSLFDRLSW